LAARASGPFANMLGKQLDNCLTLSDIIDDCNLVKNNTTLIEEEELDSISEAEGEGSSEE
jgi:hypothetical protein